MDLIPFLLQGKQYNTIFIIVLFLNKAFDMSYFFSFLLTAFTVGSVIAVTLIHVPHAELRSHQFKTRVQLAELVSDGAVFRSLTPEPM